MTSQLVSRAPLTDESAGPRAGVLTSLEREVLELVTQGYLDQQIAGRLALSTSSIETCVRLVCRKIDVSTRAEAVQWGVHHGAGC